MAAVVLPLTVLGAAVPSGATTPSWVVGASYPAIAEQVESLACPSASVCVALASTSSYSLAIFGTSDGGSTWSELDAPSLSDQASNGGDVVCVSTTVCEAAGWVDSSGDAVLLATTDGGTTWTSQTVTQAAYVGGIVCPSTSVCEALGGTSVSSPGWDLVLGTTDGGTTWVTQTMPSGLNGSVGDIACASSTVCEGSVTPSLASGISGIVPQLVGTTDGGTTWTLQSITANDIDFGGLTLACPSTAECVAIGAEQLLTGDPVVLTTTDGGTTWGSNAVPTGVEELNVVVCPSTTVCKVTADASGGPVILASSDGGSTWSAHSLPAGVAEVDDLACPSTTACVASGSDADTGDLDMLNTTDGGSTWTIDTLPAEAFEGSGSGTIACPSTTVCDVTAGGQLFGTGDGGSTWNAQTLSEGAVPGGLIACASAAVCVAVGYKSSGDSVAFVTTDGGSTWSSSPMPAGVSVGAIVCPSSDVCEAEGNDSATGLLVMVRTDDGGHTWVEQPLPEPINQVAGSLVCPSVSTCMATGFDDYTLATVVLGTTDGGSTWNELPVNSGTTVDALVCPSTTVCEASGELDGGPVILGTTDGGRTWNSQSLPVGVSGLDEPACPSTTMCEIEASEGSGLVMLGTTNGGNTWTVQPLPSTASLDGFNLVCPSVTVCDATGVDNTSGDPVVLDTTDGGSAWGVESLPVTVNFVDTLVCPSSSVCEATGGNLATETVIMLGTSDGGTTWASQPLPAGVVSSGALVCPSAALCAATATTDTASDLLVYASAPQPLSVTTTSLPDAAAGSAYSQWVNASGGTGPYTWSVASGALPTGLTLDSATGAITGTPMDLGTSTFTVSVTDSEAPTASATSDSLSITVDPTSSYTAVAPYRICDTRGTDGLSGTDAQCAGHALVAGQPLTIQVSGTNPSGSSSGGVPSGVMAVVLNVTVTGEGGQGYLTVWPAGDTRPTASSLNYRAGKTVANLVTVELSGSGQISLYSLQATNLVVDVEGYYAEPFGTAGLLNPVTPYRICDTRSNGNTTPCAGQTLSGDHPLTIGVTGTEPPGESTGGVPASGVSAVILNVTAIGHGTGYLTAYPAGVSAPTASNLNFTAGQVVPNRVIVPVSASGQISLVSNTSVDVVVDVNGWFTDGSSLQTGALFLPASPSRICDTRLNGNATPCASQTVIGGGLPLDISVAGQGPVPASGVVAVVANLTATDTTAQSYLTAWPTGQSQPTASDLNWVAGLTVPNMTVVALGTGGDVSVYLNGGTADVIVDVTGWYVEES